MSSAILEVLTWAAAIRVNQVPQPTDWTLLRYINININIDMRVDVAGPAPALDFLQWETFYSGKAVGIPPTVGNLYAGAGSDWSYYL